MANHQWQQTKFPGVRFRQHPTRKHGVAFDRYFVVRYQRDGKRIEEPVGWASEGWTAEKASETLSELKKASKFGEEGRSLRERRGADEKRREELARQAAQNKAFRDVVALFLEDATGRLRASTVRGYRCCLNEAVEARPTAGLPVLGDWSIRSIKRRDLAGIIAKIAKGTPAKAVLMRSSLSACFSFAVESPEEYADSNPVRDLKRTARPMPRQRSLTDEEIWKLWAALNDEKTPGDAPMKRLIGFALLTGCRLGEGAGLQRKEIAGSWWEIPDTRFKGKRPHRVFVTNTAAGLISGKVAMPFVSPRKSKSAYDGSSVSRYLKRRGYFGLPKFTAHDLRRTVASGLANLGFSLEVIAATLGHKLAGVTADHYIKHRYDREKQMALEVWERHVLSVTAEKKLAPVVAIKKKTA